MDLFKRLWDWLTDFVYDIAYFFIMLLPASPFQEFAKEFQQDTPFENILNYLNYFVPIGAMVSFFVTYVAAVAVWYVCRWALRLVRYIQ